MKHSFNVLCVLAVLAAATAVTASPRHGVPHASSKAGQRPSLHMAILADSVAHTTKTVRRLLALGVPVTRYCDGTDGRPIIDAVAFGYMPIVSQLLERGADVNAKDRQGETALLVAAGNSGPGYLPIIQLLLTNGANPNAIDNRGITPLDEAAFGGDSSAVTVLLNAHANPNTLDKLGRAPIEWASYNGYPEIVRLLQASGARINARSGLPRPQQRILDERLIAYLAATGKSVEQPTETAGMQTLLRQGADPSARAVLWNYGQPSNLGEITTPLLACHSADVFALLLAQGADVDGLGGPLLGPDLATTRQLLALEAHKHDGHLQGAGERLLAAACFPTPPLAELVLHYGAPVDARDGRGKTSLMVTYSEAVLKTLLAHGADINARDSAGETALMQAANQIFGEGSVAACDAPWAEVLLRHGADPNRRNHDGDTALMLLARQGEYGHFNSGEPITLARLLLSHGARKGLRNKYGHTALQIAQRARAVSLARLIRHTKYGVTMRGQQNAEDSHQ